MKRLLSIVTAISITQASFADEMVTMPGPSMYKCTQWLEAKNGALRTPLAMWVFGFVSGSNLRTVQAGNEQAEVLDNDAALAFADKFCQDNPNHALGQLAIGLIEKFGGPKSRHEWIK